MGGCESLWHLLTSSQLIPSPYIQQPQGPKLNGLVRWAFNIRDGGLLKIIVFTDLKNTPEKKRQHFAGHDRRLDGLGKPRLHHQENDQLRFDLLISWSITWTSFALQFYNFKLACSATEEVVKYSRLGQHKSFTTNEVSLPSMLSTCFNTGMQLCQKMPIISDQASEIPDLPLMSQISLSNLLRQQWAYEIHKTLSIKKLPECCHLLHLQWRYLHGERRENYKKRMAMATMFISKQLSWFRNSKAFNEKRSEWIPGKNMDEPWTILTRLSQAQSAHGFGSSQGCLPVCMILIQLDWFILVSYHPDIISAILFQTAKDVEFLYSSMFNHWMHHHLPAYYFQLPWLFQDVSGMVWLGHVGSTAPSQRAKVPNDSSEPNSSA